MKETKGLFEKGKDDEINTSSNINESSFNLEYNLTNNESEKKICENFLP